MAVKYVNKDWNNFIRYICLSTDTKPTGDVGNILYTYDNSQYFINVDGATNWQPYLAPKLTV